MNILRFPFIALFLCGCVKHFNGPELTEPGEVYATCFLPKGHGDDIALGTSVDSNGNLTATITPISVDIPARYAIVFKCQHGKFVIDGNRGKELYQKLDKGDSVTIRYCEVFEVRDHKTNAVDLHFLTADRIKE